MSERYKGGGSPVRLLAGIAGSNPAGGRGFQVATTCFSCSPPNLNLVVTNFKFCLHVK